MSKSVPKTRSRLPLIVAAEPETCSAMLRALGPDLAPHARTARGIEEVRRARLDDVDLVLAADRLPDGTGLDVAAHLLRRGIVAPIVLVCGPGREGFMDAARQAARGSDVGRLHVAASAEPRAVAMAVEHALGSRVQQETIERLQRELRAAQDEIETRRRDFERVIEQLELRTRTDALTGLANRHWLNLMLAGSFAEAMRHDLPLGCLMIDLDDFKRVNDTGGHAAGDELLRRTGRVLQANCRSLDTAARYGGDEFCVLVPHAEPEETETVARRILDAFGVAVEGLPGSGSQVRMTIGMAHNRVRRPKNADELIHHADEALYAGKAAGKNRASWGDVVVGDARP